MYVDVCLRVRVGAGVGVGVGVCVCVCVRVLPPACPVALGFRSGSGFQKSTSSCPPDTKDRLLTIRPVPG